jgi:hypothetical protein
VPGAGVSTAYQLRCARLRPKKSLEEWEKLLTPEFLNLDTGYCPLLFIDSTVV